MRQEAIFGPVCALALWTLGVLFMTGFRRIGAGMAGRLPHGAFRLGESADVPDDVKIWNRNLINLLEVPLLFYVACLVFYVTRQVTAHVVTIAWIYVALRVAHSLIHLTFNRILPRLLIFAAGNVVLVWQWIHLARRLLF
jgi:hypothetical protein